jgi:hypothetical protein
MKAAFLAAVLLAGCSTYADSPATDTAAIAGNWREVRRDGRIARSGYAVSISTFSSFAARKGCVVTGGMLRPLGDGRYRIERYETGYATEGCGPWRGGPEVAPFDGPEVRLVRQGNLLVASGGRRRVEFRWLGAAVV